MQWLIDNISWLLSGLAVALGGAAFKWLYSWFKATPSATIHQRVYAVSAFALCVGLVVWLSWLTITALAIKNAVISLAKAQASNYAELRGKAFIVQGYTALTHGEYRQAAFSYSEGARGCLSSSDAQNLKRALTSLYVSLAHLTHRDLVEMPEIETTCSMLLTELEKRIDYTDEFLELKRGLSSISSRTNAPTQ